MVVSREVTFCFARPSSSLRHLLSDDELISKGEGGRHRTGTDMSLLRWIDEPFDLYLNEG